MTHFRTYKNKKWNELIKCTWKVTTRVRKSRYRKGNASIPPSTAVTQRSLPTCSLANYVLPPCTVNSCLCTSCAVGAPTSASLCSEHVTQTSYCSRGQQLWEKLRHRAVAQRATLAHPWVTTNKRWKLNYIARGTKYFSR